MTNVCQVIGVPFWAIMVNTAFGECVPKCMPGKRLRLSIQTLDATS